MIPDLCVTDAETGNVYIMMEARLVALYKSEEEYKILERYGELLNQKFLAICGQAMHSSQNR